jgi:hypothetical protein
MKKILLLVSSISLLANGLYAQDNNATGNEQKTFRFGLKISPTPTWLRSNELNYIKNDGIKLGFGFGLQTEFSINSTASFVTGLGGDFLGGKQTYLKGQGYVLTKDNEYTESKNTKFTEDNTTVTDKKFYEINSRTTKISYVTIPIMLKLMTKDIAHFKYFGVFGGNIAVQTKFRVTDEITELRPNGTTYTEFGKSNITEMRPDGDLIPVNLGLNAGIGAEYNLSGSTSVFVSLNYLRGFINQYQNTSEIMVDQIRENLNNKTQPKSSKQSALSDGMQLNIGILF